VAGQTIHVQSPDGRTNAIVIPPGFGPGSTFTVEFAPDTTPPPETAQAQYDTNKPMASAAAVNGYGGYGASAPVESLPTAQPTYTTTSAQGNGGAAAAPVQAQVSRPDDGFATGFGR